MVSMLSTAPVMPHLFFEEESVEDRNASLAAGGLISKSVDMVTIRQPGSKDDVKREAGPWLATLPQNPNWSPEWVERAKAMYKQFKEGLEITQVGTHVRMWPPISKAEAETLMAAGLRTVEELALANEQSISRIGIGGRDLKQRAQAWLDSASKDGRAAGELAVLREANAKQGEQIADLMAKLNQLLAAQAPTQGVGVATYVASVPTSAASGPAPGVIKTVEIPAAETVKDDFLE